MGAPSSATGKSIVVVDDHEDMRAFMQTALEGAGYEVRTAEDGAQALKLLGKRPAELIVTDIFMPGLEGFETISRCRAEFPRIPLIVMSAGTLPGLEHDFLASAALLGVAATLRKPFTADQLIDVVRGVLLPR